MALSGGIWAGQKDKPLVLAVYEWRPKQDLMARWQPLASHLGKFMNGRAVELVVLSEKELAVALDAGKVDFLFVNPRYYTQLRVERQLTGPLASVIERDGDIAVGDLGGAIFVRAGDARIRSLADLRGRHIAIAGKEYMGAYLAPAHTLIKAGIDISRDAHLVTYPGKQIETLKALQDGRADAAFVRSGLFEELAREGRLDPAGYRILNPQQHRGFPWQTSTDLYPNWPFVALKHVDPELAAKAAAALFSINAHDEVAKAANIYGFSVPGDYIQVEDALRQLHLPPFAHTAQITAHDLWRHFSTQIFIALLALGIIVLLAVALFFRTCQLGSSRKALEAYQGRLEALVDAKTEALSEALKHFDGFMNMAPTAFAIVGLDGRVRYMNPGFEALFGYTIDDIPDMDTWWVRAYPDADYREERARTWHALLTESLHLKTNVKGFEGRVCCKSGDFVWVDAYAQVTDDAVHIALVDITIRKRQETEILSLNRVLESRAAEAEAANVAKSTFLANMSHEIRTPMNAILGFVHLLKKEELTARQYERLSRIGTAAEHLLSLIDDILDISKIEAGKVTLDIVDFDLTGLLEQVAELMALRTQAKGLELILDIEEGPVPVRGDPLRLRQILINYLGNAIKFTESGFVLLRARILDRSDEHVTCRFEVEDSGRGVNPERLEKIFEVFEQEDSSTTREFGGSGLGLTINKHLAHLMQGDVGVRSDPGHGSTFWASVRLGRSAACAEPPRGYAVAGLRILAVDDLAMTRMIHERLLRKSGAEAEAVASGPAALEAVRRADGEGRPFGLLLIDLLMEGIDGFATLAAIRALPLQTPPAAILVTASNDIDIVEKARQAGFADVLMKPLTIDNLDAAYRRSIAHHIEVSDAPLDAGQRISLRHPGRKVLLAEDEPINQIIACELLESVGLNVTVVDDGLAACEAAQRTAFDLIILDMQMPRLDGVAAARRLREHPASRNTPIIAMTANAFAEDREKCLEAGMNDFVSKPVSPDVLFGILLQRLDAAATAG